MRFKTVFLAMAITFSNPIWASAEWDLRSENKSSGLTAIASTYWLENRGSVTFDDLVRVQSKEGSYWAILMLSCVRKSLLMGVSLNVTGSGNQEVLIDDPGYTYLRFNNKPLSKFKTSGSDIPSTIMLASPQKKIVPKLRKSNSLSLAIRDVKARKTIQIRFDTSALSKASTRFRSAGCKI